MKIRSIISIAAVLLGTVSCGFLEFDETHQLKQKEHIYNYFAETQKMLTHVYSYMPQDLGAVGGAMRDCASDDAEFGKVSGKIQAANDGTWSPIKTFDDSWKLYEGIRAANGFIEDVANVDFSRFENDKNYENDMKRLKFFPYEARVLRAFYFFELARRYGDIAMPLTRLAPEEANRIGKTSFNDVISYVVSECDAVKDELPLTYVGLPGNETGRVTKGFAMAVKSKALLYRASRLHNPQEDKELWKASAQAALDIINLGQYQLDKNETANNEKSKEIVLLRMNSENNSFELRNFPLRFTEGQRAADNLADGTFPSQNLVDAFETKAGYTVTLTENGWESEDPAFNPSAPYANRDPRFYRAVLTNGQTFKGQTIETFIGGADDRTVAQGGTPTGYFLKKYVQESTSFKPDKLVSNKHHWVIYRYAETLLTYAESMVEAFGDPSYKDAVFTLSAEEALNQVRANAGMPEISVSDKDGFIRKLRNEWRVEFAFEDHRFWDIRRWMIGDRIPNALYGVKIERTGSGFTYTRTTYENRVWKDCMYLYPIPQNEIFNDPGLNPQNQGW